MTAARNAKPVPIMRLVHLRAKRTDGVLTAHCIRHHRGDPRESLNSGELRISSDRDRVTCTACRAAEVT
jgi:hypothetical protein